MILSRNPINRPVGNHEELLLDEATYNKIRRHIADKNDVISEDDIRNVRTDIYEPGSKAISGEDGEKVATSDNHNDDAQEDTDKVLTPWDVLKPST